MRYSTIFCLLLLLYVNIEAAYSINRHSDFLDKHKSGSTLPYEELIAILQQEHILVVDKRPTLPYSFSTPSGNFLIHYSTADSNAIPLEDADVNGYPDYLDSVAYYLDYVYYFITDTLGYMPPLPDSGSGGSDAYDVYLIDIGNGVNTYYGITIPDQRILVTDSIKRYTSFMIIDNDFSPHDSTIVNDTIKIPTYNDVGMKGLKMTVAHEFHHAIQYTYNKAVSATLQEMTSTFMSDRIFSESVDNRQFLENFLRNISNYPFGVDAASNGYRYTIFAQYLFENYGDTTLRRLWEIAAGGVNGYHALDKALGELGTSLDSEFCTFLIWLYHTGSRSVPGMYFSNADSISEVDFYREENCPPFDFIDEGDSAKLKSFEIRPFRCFLPTEAYQTADTVDIFIADTDLEAAIKQNNKTKPYKLTVSDHAQSGIVQINGSDYFYGLEAGEGDVCDELFLRGGIQTNAIVYPFPNPYKRKLHRAVYFPVPAKAALDDKVTLRLYSSDMIKIKFENESIESPLVIESSGKRVVRVQAEDLPKDLSSGVYIFTTSCGGAELIGKITIVE